MNTECRGIWMTRLLSRTCEPRHISLCATASQKPVSTLPASDIRCSLRIQSLRLGCNIQIICEHDGPAIKFRLVCSLEFLHRFRLGMGGVCRLVLEDEDVHEACRVIVLLPGRIDTRAWLMGTDIR